MTVTLKTEKKCPGVYLIVANAVPFAAFPTLSYSRTVNSAILDTVTTRIRRGTGIYGLWTRVHIGAYAVAPRRPQSVTPTAWICRALYTSDTQLATLYEQLHQPSLQSCQVPVVNYAARGMSLLETSSL